MELLEYGKKFIYDLRHRILVMDGAMGTRIMELTGSAIEFCEILCKSDHDLITGIHREYATAGADIIKTNTFNANAVSMRGIADNGFIHDINLRAVTLARSVADVAGSRRVYVAGSMGPSRVLLSRCPNESDFNALFSLLKNAYSQQTTALLKGGVDLLLLETIIDSANAKAAMSGISEAFKIIGHAVPVMLSISADTRGKLLSGESVEDFAVTLNMPEIVSIGLNCGYGTQQTCKWLTRLQQLPYFVSVHPNAGLPDKHNIYPDTPERMSSIMAEHIAAGRINIVGGCCGTTPAHIKAISEQTKSFAPRRTFRASALFIC